MPAQHPYRIFLRLYLPLTLLVGVGVYFYGQADLERDLVRVRSQETLHVGLGAGALSRALESVTLDLNFLSNHPALREAVDSGTARNLKHLSEDFANFSRSKGVFDQMRWIDETGMEVVRIDLVKGEPVVVARDNLQNKGDRYYFIDSLKLNPGEIFISPLDLNIEQDKIEVPYKPMVRVATPIADSRGTKRGIVILNVYGRILLDAFAKATSTASDHVMVANSQGYWLKSPVPGEEWGFMFNRSDLSLAARHPEAWGSIRASDSGQVMCADGLWTWQTAHPLLVSHQPSMGSSTAFAPSLDPVEANGYGWKSVAHLSTGTLLAMRYGVWRMLAFVTAAMLGVLGFGSWKLACAWTALELVEENLRRLNADLGRQVDERTKELGHKVAQLNEEIAEHKRAEQSLKESEEHYRILFEYVPDGILIADQESFYKDANASMCRMLGYTHDELVGLHASDIVHQEEMQNIEPALNAIKAKSDYHRTWQFRRKDNTVFSAEVLATMMPNGELLAMIRDITEDLQAEEEKAKLQAQLHQAQKMESLGALAGGVAHDMNNVLGAILGLASANIDAQPAGSQAHQAFGTIIKATERGGKMLKGLLNFARQSPAEEHELDMNAILREEIRLLERTTLAKVRLEMDLASDLRPIRGDASALNHAVMNLCVNAVDAMPQQGSLILRTRNVDNDWIEVVVEDTGCGMHRDVLAKALDPFFTTKGQGKGTGLGLALVYSTVKAHRGQMEIQSEQGRGTCVRLRFPACETMGQSTEPVEDKRYEPVGAPMRVLLVDDDELIQGSVKAVLAALGHTVIPALTGEAALVELEGGLEPDVVILDMNMPGLGGSGTLPRLRVLRPEVPVLLATGKVDQFALDLLAAHPGVTLLPKPFSMGDLQRHLGSLRGGL